MSSQSSSSRNNNNINHNNNNINHNINNIPVLYETDRILIVNKPFGIGHHTEHHHGAATDDNINTTTDTTTTTTTTTSSSSSSLGIVQLLRQQRSNNNNKQQKEQERLYGVHRLDKVTSGILVFAKDSEMAATLSRKFSRGEIQKIYFGVSAKKPKKKKQGWVMGEMVRSRRETGMLTTTTTRTTNEKNNKKNKKDTKNYAKTRFFTSSMNHNPNNGNTNTGNINTFTNINTAVFAEAYCYGPRTVIMFIPYTGKTHQLRVAAKSMGIPLMGDPLYEPKLISNVKDTTNNENDDDRTSSTTTNNDNIQPYQQQQPQQYPVYRTMLHATGIYIPSCDVVDTPIAVWSDPPFFDDDNNNEKTLFHCQVEKLMTKHCPNQQLYEAMMMTVQQQQQ